MPLIAQSFVYFLQTIHNNNNNPIIPQFKHTPMQSLQQSIFQNLSKQTQYNQTSKSLTPSSTPWSMPPFPKYRRQEIQNQFSLIDLHNRGKLSQAQIIAYLSDKYQWVNTSILKELFRSMNWDGDNMVDKQQFVNKYLEREKKLYYEITGLKYYPNWVWTLQEIYTTTLKTHVPVAYFYTQIRSVQLYPQSQAQSGPIQWMNLIVEHEDHETRQVFQIQQSYHIGHPSFQIWLPAKRNCFFFKVTFVDAVNPENVYGQCYVNIPFQQENGVKLERLSNYDVDIAKNGVKVGVCSICIYAQQSIQKVQQQLSQIAHKQHSYSQLSKQKTKQYEYLQFLWGIRHRSPHKISPLDTKWMLAFRLVSAILLGLLGLVAHVFGRFDPLALILSFVLFMIWQYVMYRVEKFVVTVLVVLAVVLDVIWIALCSGEISQINFIISSVPLFMTYALLAVKILLLGYLIFVESALSGE